MSSLLWCSCVYYPMALSNPARQKSLGLYGFENPAKERSQTNADLLVLSVN